MSTILSTRFITSSRLSVVEAYTSFHAYSPQSGITSRHINTALLKRARTRSAGAVKKGAVLALQSIGIFLAPV